MKHLLIFLILLSLIATVSADTTLIFISNSTGSQDGYTRNTTAIDFSNVYTSTGTDIDTSGYINYLGLQSTTTVNQSNRIWRSLYKINTTNLPAGTITGATLYVFGNGKGNGLGSFNLGISGFTPTTIGGNIATGDHQRFLTTRYASDISYASFSTSGYNAMSFNADGLSAINKTGYTYLMLRSDKDIDNAFNTVTWASAVSSSFLVRTADYSAGIQGPYLSIVTTAADTTPPDSITGLSISMIDCNKTAINWTNPTTSDYYRLNVWRNGTFLYNLSNTTTSDYWTGLPNNTAMMFNSTTEDLTGNRNTTHWQNISWTTSSCPAVGPTPTPTPTPAPALAGCSYFNATAISFGLNSTDWNATEGLTTWGITTTNISQGNVSWWMCRATPTPTPTPLPWQPQINPSTDRKIEWTLKGIWYYLFGG